MTEPTGDDTIDRIVADAREVADRPLAEQPDAYQNVYEELAARLSDQPGAGRPGQ
ncbi:hypothetical protein [Spelaeicoccus albus]|uniref:Uncharacterized protein n=1 Tax=Spelaeicoccus albus TaxID=1280376 RepID=A0A7Z0D5A0_9MICO|nr:hypothetical protein [Spelaeicoccus albus]NYI69098.1 hypothetical protein [Spelaeicoccus albus]